MTKKSKSTESPQAQHPLLGPARCCLFCGDDVISRNLARAQQLAAIRSAYTDVSDERFESGDESFLEFTERCMTPSLFSSNRIITIYHAETLAADDVERLEELMTHDLPDVFLFVEINEPAADGRETKKSTGKAASAAAIKKFIKNRVADLPERFFYFDFPKPRDYETAKWLNVNVPRFFNRTIDIASAEHLIDLIGHDFNSLYSELQKIDVHLDDGAAISPEAINTVVGVFREFNPFELAQALAAKNMVRTLEVIEGLCIGSFSSAACIPTLFRQFWSMFKIVLFLSENPQKAKAFLSGNYTAQNTIGVEIGIAAGLLTAAQAKSVFPKIIKSNIVKLSTGFSMAQYTGIFTLLADHDVGVKTGKIDDSKLNMQWLCYRIIHHHH